MSKVSNNGTVPFYKKWWFWTIIALLLICIVFGGSETDETDPSSGSNTTTVDPSSEVTTVPSLSEDITDPATEPTTGATTEPTTIPATEPSTVPSTEAPTDPSTDPAVTIPSATDSISTTSPTQKSTSIEFIAWPQTTTRNENVTVTIHGAPYTEYSITVYYKSGASDADGLERKTSDADGYVSWTWHIGGRTSAGTFEITVQGGGEKETVEFTIIE